MACIQRQMERDRAGDRISASLRKNRTAVMKIVAQQLKFGTRGRKPEAMAGLRSYTPDLYPHGISTAENRSVCEALKTLKGKRQLPWTVRR